MQGRKSPDELMARMLVESQLKGLSDSVTAQRYEVSKKTVINQRRRLSEDSDFASLYTSLLVSARADWTDDISSTMKELLRFIKVACQKADPSDPKIIRAINESLKCLADIEFTRQIIDARLSSYDD